MKIDKKFSYQILNLQNVHDFILYHFERPCVQALEKYNRGAACYIYDFRKFFVIYIAGKEKILNVKCHQH